jgi:hypothetical protein
VRVFLIVQEQDIDGYYSAPMVRYVCLTRLGAETLLRELEPKWIFDGKPEIKEVESGTLIEWDGRVIGQ